MSDLLHADLIAFGLIGLVLLFAGVLYVLGETTVYVKQRSDYDLTQRIAGRRRRR